MLLHGHVCWHSSLATAPMADLNTYLQFSLKMQSFDTPCDTLCNPRRNHSESESEPNISGPAVRIHHYTPLSTGASHLYDRLPRGERGSAGGQHLRVAVAGDRAGMAMAFSR